MAQGLTWAAIALLAASKALAQTGTGVKCGPGNLCPSNSPCCSQYGECGVGAYCLGGCDPLFSNTLDSCVPEPVCASQEYSFSTLNGITDQKQYLGDASKSDWVASGVPLQGSDNNVNDSVILTLAQQGDSSSGTLLASTHYVWYGKVTARMKTSRGAGVVSAFILLSDNKDEIDYEFVGTDLHTAQSNFYYQGITNYNQGKNLTLSSGSDTFSQYHNYTIDWQPDTITWSVDGTTMRTLNKKDTYNTTDNQYHYPQTPSRVQLSLWPAGLSKNGQGTVDWAGGLIDWTTQDVKTNGYYYAMFEGVSVECYQPPSNTNSSGKNSYIYTNNQGTQSSISISDKSTILKSLLGTGTDMNKDYPNTKPSGTKSASAAAATSQVATIPGLTGAGPGTDGTRGSSDGGSGSSSSSGSGSGSGGSGTASTNSGGSSGSGDFSQGSGSGSGSGSSSAGGKGSSGAPGREEVTMGSMFAALMAFAGMLLMM